MTSLLQQKEKELHAASEVSNAKFRAIYDKNNHDSYKQHPDFPAYEAAQAITSRLYKEHEAMLNVSQMTIKAKCGSGDVAADFVKALRDVMIVKKSSWRRVKPTYSKEYISLTVTGLAKNKFTEGWE